MTERRRAMDDDKTARWANAVAVNRVPLLAITGSTIILLVGLSISVAFLATRIAIALNRIDEGVDCMIEYMGEHRINDADHQKDAAEAHGQEYRPPAGLPGRPKGSLAKACRRYLTPAEIEELEQHESRLPNGETTTGPKAPARKGR